MANLLLTPENFGASGSWNNLRTFDNDNQVIALDDTLTGDEIGQDATTNTHGMSQSVTVAAATQYTFSVFAKYKDWQWIALYPDLGPNNGYYFDILNGVIGDPIGTPDSGEIVDYGDGWYRCIVTTTSTLTGASCIIFFGNSTGTALSFAGDNNSAFYVWGAQLNLGAEADDYVAESGSIISLSASRNIIAVTRRQADQMIVRPRMPKPRKTLRSKFE